LREHESAALIGQSHRSTTAAAVTTAAAQLHSPWPHLEVFDDVLVNVRAEGLHRAAVPPVRHDDGLAQVGRLPALLGVHAGQAQVLPHLVHQAVQVQPHARRHHH